MDIQRAKEEIKRAVQAYLATDDIGRPLIPAVRQRPILLMGPPGVGKTHPDVRPLRDVFGGYELLAYLSIRATQLGLKACEVPVTRAYPATGKTPTKISGFKGNSDLMKVLLNALAGKYNP